MKQGVCIFLAGLLLMGRTIFSQDSATEAMSYWPSWRGPLNTGEAPLGCPPVRWSEGENIKWKTAIPGKGLSTPVIWGKQIFITTAIPMDEVADKEAYQSQKKGRPMWMKALGASEITDNLQRFVVMCLSREDGSVLWQKTVREVLPHEGTHKDASWSSSSCVTDGEHIIASFGSNGFYCFDMQGHLIWEKDLGDMTIYATFGEGISPVIYENFLIIVWDHEGESFITALNKSTGETRWKTPRDNETGWSTPIVVDVDGKPQIVVAGTRRSRGYDLETGKPIWSLGGMTMNQVPCPVQGEGIVYLLSGFRGHALQAVRLSGARGELDESDHLLWTWDRETPYIPSPLLHKGKLYFFKGYKSSLSCLNAENGTVHYTKQRLNDMKGIYASPVATDGKIYAAGRNGVVYVFKPGKMFETLSINFLDDGFDASPAIAGNELYLRGLKYLYCICE